MSSRINEIKTSKLVVLKTAIKVGSSVANPVLNIVASGGSILWTTTLDATDPIDAITNGSGVLKLSGSTSWVNYEKAPSANGTADHAEILDRNGDLCRTVTVGVSTGELRLPSLDLVTTSNLKFSAAPTIVQS
jgi:hypothetical protein